MALVTPSAGTAAPPAATPAGFLARQAAWKPQEIAFWLLALAMLFIAPNRAALLNEIAILALFALSIDLILGYAGIVSLGHAAFFGFGAYAAGLFAKHASADPLAGLAVGMGAAGLLGLLTSPLILRGSDLTRLMVTLGVALILGELANSLGGVTGGADGLQGIMMGPVLGLFEFDIFGSVAYLYSLAVLFVLFVLARRIVGSPFGLSLRAIRDNPLRAAASGVPLLRVGIGAPAYAYLAVPAVVLSLGAFLLVRNAGLMPEAAAPVVVLLANALLSLPFVMAALAPPFDAIAQSRGKLIRSLGLGGLRQFTAIEWPLLARDVGLVLALSFCFSLGDLGVIALFDTQDFVTLPLLMVRALGAYRTNDAATIAALMLVLTIAAFIALPALFERLSRART